MFALCFAACSLGCGGGEAEEDVSTSDASSEESETGEPPAPGDSCEDTLLRVEAPATIRASLQRATPSQIPGCGIDGPVVFMHLRASSRVDLSAHVRGRAAQPKLALMRPGCVSESADPSRILACAEALPTTLFDLGPGVEMVVAVGLAADDPALAAPEFDPEAGALDPLEFELELDVRVVLEEGDRCGQAKTRCEAGTLCMDASEPGEAAAPRCVRPEADSCVSPGTSVLELGQPTLLEIPPEEAHSDAHEHACTGWRRPERVERLELPSSLPEGTQLRVRANDGRVGLALRGPSCDPQQALACAPAAGADETFLQWGDASLVELAASGQAPLLFVELPPDTALEPLDAVSVSIELF